MSQQDGDLQPSFLDLLLDESEVYGEVEPGASLREIEHAVLHDIEDLLNTQHDMQYVAQLWPEVGRSLLVYGLPGLTSFNPSSQADVDRVREYIAFALKTHEPRLASVRVNVVERDDLWHGLRFRVEGYLKITPIRKKLNFDTVIEAEPASVVIVPG